MRTCTLGDHFDERLARRAVHALHPQEGGGRIVRNRGRFVRPPGHLSADGLGFFRVEVVKQARDFEAAPAAERTVDVVRRDGRIGSGQIAEGAAGHDATDECSGGYRYARLRYWRRRIVSSIKS